MAQNVRRRFGQNFLEPIIAAKIAADLPCSREDEVLEIGPGHGALTEHLLPKCKCLTAVEIDNFCIPKLQQKFSKCSNFNLVHKNFLTFELEAWAASHNKAYIAGNLPYNMATSIILHVLPQINKFKICMFMTQLEVAERICAKPCSKQYGSLSVFIACYANAKIQKIIPPEHFNPKPKVQSATIILEPLEKPVCENENFFEFIKAAFSQKRKTLANSLSFKYDKDKVQAVINKLSIKENVRAEELSLEKFIFIFNELY